MIFACLLFWVIATPNFVWKRWISFGKSGSLSLKEENESGTIKPINVQRLLT